MGKNIAYDVKMCQVNEYSKLYRDTIKRIKNINLSQKIFW